MSAENVKKTTAALQSMVTTEIKKQTEAMDALARKVDRLGEAKGDMGACPVGAPASLLPRPVEDLG